MTACVATFILSFGMPKMTHSHYNLWNVRGSGGHMTYVLDKYRSFTCASLLHFLILFPSFITFSDSLSSLQAYDGNICDHSYIQDILKLLMIVVQ